MSSGNGRYLNPISYRFGFIIEQMLGHITHGQTLRANVAQDPAVEAYWGLPAWKSSGFIGKVPNWTVQAGWQTRRFLADMNRQTELDALFFHTQVTAVLAPKWLQRIPSIVSLDATPRQYDQLGQYYAHKSGPAWLEQWKWKLNRNCFRAAKHIVAWSEWARQSLITDYEVPAAKITVIPPGVNTKEWARPAPRPAPRRYHDQPVKILFVGGNLARKGGLLLLEAFRALRKTVDGADSAVTLELHLVTKDTLPPEPGVFLYNHMQPNSAPLKQLYHESDIFCLPTYGDCLPMVLSEAGAAGLPIISTKVAAIPEIVRDEQTGFLISPGDVPAIITALRHLIQNPDLRQTQGAQAVERARRAYDAENNAARLLALLKQTADEAGR